MKTGKDLVDALCQHGSLLPRLACPESIFFLLNEDNFMRAWNYWLGPGLQRCGKKVKYF